MGLELHDPKRSKGHEPEPLESRPSGNDLEKVLHYYAYRYIPVTRNARGYAPYYPEFETDDDDDDDDGNITQIKEVELKPEVGFRQEFSWYRMRDPPLDSPVLSPKQPGTIADLMLHFRSESELGSYEEKEEEEEPETEDEQPMFKNRPVPPVTPLAKRMPLSVSTHASNASRSPHSSLISVGSSLTELLESIQEGSMSDGRTPSARSPSSAGSGSPDMIGRLMVDGESDGEFDEDDEQDSDGEGLEQWVREMKIEEVEREQRRRGSRRSSYRDTVSERGSGGASYGSDKEPEDEPEERRENEAGDESGEESEGDCQDRPDDKPEDEPGGESEPEDGKKDTDDEKKVSREMEQTWLRSSMFYPKPPEMSQKTTKSSTFYASYRPPLRIKPPRSETHPQDQEAGGRHLWNGILGKGQPRYRLSHQPTLYADLYEELLSKIWAPSGSTTPPLRRKKAMRQSSGNWHEFQNQIRQTIQSAPEVRAGIRDSDPDDSSIATHSSTALGSSHKETDSDSYETERTTPQANSSMEQSKKDSDEELNANGDQVAEVAGPGAYTSSENFESSSDDDLYARNAAPVKKSNGNVVADTDARPSQSPSLKLQLFPVSTSHQYDIRTQSVQATTPKCPPPQHSLFINAPLPLIGWTEQDIGKPPRRRKRVSQGDLATLRSAPHSPSRKSVNEEDTNGDSDASPDADEAPSCEIKHDPYIIDPGDFKETIIEKPEDGGPIVGVVKVVQYNKRPQYKETSEDSRRYMQHLFEVKEGHIPPSLIERIKNTNIEPEAEQTNPRRLAAVRIAAKQKAEIVRGGKPDHDYGTNEPSPLGPKSPNPSTPGAALLRKLSERNYDKSIRDPFAEQLKILRVELYAREKKIEETQRDLIRSGQDYIALSEELEAERQKNQTHDESLSATANKEKTKLIEELKEKYRNVKIKFFNERDEHNQLQEQYDTLYNTACAQKDDLEKSEREIIDLKMQIEIMEKEKLRIETNIEKGEHDSEKAIELQIELCGLKSELQQTRDDLIAREWVYKKAEDRLTLSEETVTNLTVTLDETERAYEQAQIHNKHLAAKDGWNKKLKKEQVDLTKTLENILKEWRYAPEDTIKRQLEAFEKAWKDRLDEMETDLKQIIPEYQSDFDQDRYDGMRYKLLENTKEVRHAQFEAEFQSRVASNATMEKNKLRATLTDVQDQLRAAQKEIEEIERSNILLKKTINEANNSRDDAMAEVREARYEVEAREQDINDLKTRLVEMAREIESLRTNNAALEGEHEQLASELTLDLEKAGSQILELEQEVKSAKAENYELNRQLENNRLEEELTLLREQRIKDRVDEENAQQKESIEQLREENERLSEQIESFKTNNPWLQEKYETQIVFGIENGALSSDIIRRDDNIPTISLSKDQLLILISGFSFEIKKAKAAASSKTYKKPTIRALPLPVDPSRSVDVSLHEAVALI
jgi:hypothetical protein